MGKGWKSNNAISPILKKHQNLCHGATMMPLLSESMGLDYSKTLKQFFAHCA